MSGWQREEPACPPWCTAQGDHLGDLLRLGSCYWHRGQVTEVETTEETPHGDHLVARAYLAQRADTGDRGWRLLPAEVVVECDAGLLPAGALRLAALITELAALINGG